MTSFLRSLLVAGYLVGVSLLGGGCADMAMGKTAFQADDYPAAARHYGELAEFGYPVAQYNYARMLLKGQGVPVDETRTRYFLERAAEQNHSRAKIPLARLYHQGLGGTKDLEKAKIIYEEQIAAGDLRMLYPLGRIHHEQGEIKKAIDLYHRAVDSGEYRAAKQLGIIHEKQAQPPALKLALAWYYIARDHQVENLDARIAKLERKLGEKATGQVRRIAKAFP